MRNPPADRARFHLRIRHVSISGLGTFPTAGLHQRLLSHGAGRLKNDDIHGAQTHVRPRAAGVSPPWAGKCASADRSVVRRQIADGVCACAWMAVAIAFIGATGGLRPPLLALIQRPSTGRITILAMHKRTFARAAGVSPPWERNAFAMARVFPRPSTFAHHGWLTPAAPVARCRSAEK
jgi:hypothetical protein